MHQERWDAVATLLGYPEESRRAGLLEACAALRAEADFPQESVGILDGFLRGTAPEELEELYTRTFDINPLCTLEIGWHLYGEDYARGAFLVEMRQTMRALGVEEGPELPDHLPSVLRALARMAEPQAEVFSQSFLQPALFKMIGSYTESNAPYHHLLRGVLAALEADFGPTDPNAAAMPETQAVPYECGRACASSDAPVEAFPDLPRPSGGR